jgi:hypothetical protein
VRTAVILGGAGEPGNSDLDPLPAELRLPTTTHSIHWSSGMLLNVKVVPGDVIIPVNVGDGSQRVSWLAMVAAQRFHAVRGLLTKDAPVESNGSHRSCCHVAV